MLSNSWSKAKYIKDIITYYLESFSEKWNVLTRIISNKIRKRKLGGCSETYVTLPGSKGAGFFLTVHTT